MNRRKANVLKPIAKAGSIKHTISPVKKFEPPLDIEKEDASKRKIGIRFMQTQGKTRAILPISLGKVDHCQIHGD